MSPLFRRNIAAGLLLLSIVLLVVGLTAPVITIRGVLVPEGVIDIASRLMAKLTPEEWANLPEAKRVAASALPKGLFGSILPKDGSAVDAYTQTRSIIGSIKSLYEHGAWFPATLILVFSVFVPVGKTVLLFLVIMHPKGQRRAQFLRIITAIGKWSMADVFVVAILIAFLAAKASPGTTQAVAFRSEFGLGFYFFAAYCIISLIGQQISQGLLANETNRDGSPS